MGNYDNNDIHAEYAELLKRAKEGDESAFTEIYRKSERLVYTTCYGILKNKEDAEDATQDTYLALYNSIDTIKEEKALLAWLSRTAFYKSDDIRSKKKPGIAYEDAIATNEITEQADDNLDSLPEAYITVKTNRDIINKIVKEELSEAQYVTTLLYYYNELPVSDIAQMMNCPEGTIKTRLSDSRKKIKKGIESYEHIFKDSLAGAAGAPFLTKFFVECSKEFTLPVINPVPVNIPVNPSALGELTDTGAKAGKLAQATSDAIELSETGEPMGEMAKAGHLAKNAGTAGSGAKSGLLASPLTKIGIAVAAVAVVAVPTVIIVSNLNKKDKDEKVYEIKFDGLYCNIDEDEGTNDIYRFYPDGNLIYTSYDFDDEDECFPTGSWFTLDSDDDRVENGTYEEDEGKIVITVEQGSKEKEYKGEINKNDITIGKDEKYKFYDFDDIDGYIPYDDDAEPGGSSVPTDTSNAADPIVGAYLDVLYQHQDGILTYETLSVPSINYMDVTDDGINELIFLYCPGDDTSYVRLAVYSYDSSSETATLMLDRDVTDYGEFKGAVFLANGNMVYKCFKIVEGDWLDEEETHMIEVEFNGGDDGTVVSVWSLFHSGDAAHNGSLAGDSSDFFAAQSDYKSQTIFPLMPDAETINYYMIPDADSEYNFMSRSIYEAGHYYYFDDLVALLSGGNPVSVKPTDTPAVTTPDGWKEAYYARVNSITEDDFDDAYLESDEFTLTYDLVYINEDDIPELIVCLKDEDSYWEFTYANIYTFNNGELIELENSLCVVSRDIVFYYPGENKIILDSYHDYFTNSCSVGAMSKSRDEIETTTYERNGEDSDLIYYKEDPFTHETIEISEDEFYNATQGFGNSEELNATLTLDEILEKLGEK